MRFTLLISLLLPIAVQASPGDTLSIGQVRELALQASPLQQKKSLAAGIAALQTRSLRSNNLPRIALGGQATWQSDVFGLPVESPLFKIPEVPKDQYKIAADVSERLWDGGSDRYQRQQRGLESDIAAAQVDVDVWQLRELVTDLYFKTLLLQESEAILLTGKSDLERRLKQVEAQVTEGVALRTAADQIRIQILKTEQQVAVTKADEATLKAVLAEWVGRKDADFFLKPVPSAKTPGNPPALNSAAAGRPEYQLFSLQKRGLQLGQEASRLRLQPRVELFAQGGLGRPNPFNFFETGFEPFLLVGLRAQWTPFDWGNRRRDLQVFELQMKNVDAQQAAFEQRLSATTRKDREEVDKWLMQLAQDDAIIALQEDIIRRAEAQVQNGVMTSTDYLAQLDLLTQARLTRKTHEVQAAAAREMFIARNGGE